MRLLPLLGLMACVPIGRQTEDGSLSIALLDRRPAWFGYDVAISEASLFVEDLVLREPVDGAWGADEFGDRFDAPVVEGVAMGAWNDARDVDLIDPLQAFLGVILLHDGRPATANFSVDGPVRLAGRGTRFGLSVMFDLEVDVDLEIRGVPTKDNREIGMGGDVGWRLDAAAVLSSLDWSVAQNGRLTADQPGVADDLTYALSDAASWRVELR